MNLNPEEKTVGKDNYYTAVSAFDESAAAGANRRDFLKTVIATSAVAGASLGAQYFGYKEKPMGDPLRVAVIGTGDEGGVLIGALNPKFVDCVAISDIRPYNVHRAFHGDWSGDTALAARPGLIKVYGYSDENAAREKIKVYTDYKDALKDPNVEAIIIALPLFLHAPVAVEAMLAGKHVLTEKLMAHSVAECKVMSRLSEKLNLYLTVGHQRHYSVLYDNAVNLIKWGVLGELHHIRAQWHRGNLPGADSWQMPLPGGEKASDSEKVLDKIKADLESYTRNYEKVRDKDSVEAVQLARKIAQWAAWDSDKGVLADSFGYKEFKLGDGRVRTALEELCRWRLFARTGGGLMAELGSHQLDASSIFCSALRRDGKKSHPLTVHAVGGRHTFPLDRDAEDHVYCMYEFPGPGYEPDFKPGYFDKAMNYPDPKTGIPSHDQDPNKKIVVTYSSINGNGFGGYGEVVMGSKGTLVLEREQEVMLYKNAETTTKVGVKEDGKGPTLDTQASGKGPALAKAAADTSGPVSRGYKEEIEHWAWCIRNKEDKSTLRCRPEVALGDAVIALATNVAIDNANSGKGGFLQFDENWYKIDHDSTPDGSKMKETNERLGAGLTIG